MYWAASDVGWVVGHSYIVYAPLFHGCTTILYEGKPVGTPDAGAFWRVIAEHGARRAVHRADRVPRHQEGRPAGQALRAIRPVEIPHAVPRRRARRSRHRRLGGEAAEEAGDRSLVADRDRLGIAGNPVGLGQLPVKHGSPTVPMPGYDVRVVDEQCKEVPRGTDGLDRRQAAAAAVVPADAVAAGRALPAKATSRSSPATTRPPTPASSTTTATST